ncbi:universal stress protein [Maritalea mediterranea]|uniref:Universal stress protein n=1 Tax=Maritalea mediterranea TaxID=2909667 RepID=A0ABS9EAK8_9HYPH|nr:universal stress protein [Maritalea mediterranea]MCF4098476.1 universal stress protein [Maritalea mediterranea]
MQSQTILALVDGSAYSESVCHYAAWMAQRTQSKVKIYHIMGRRNAADSDDLSGAIVLGARTQLLDKLSALDMERAKLAQEHGRAILEDAKAIVQGDGDIEVQTRLRQGDLVETVAAKEETGDVIVVGKRGEAHKLASGHLGSNLERVIRASHKPVLVANRTFNPVNKVLVAFDGGASSLKAVDMVANSPLYQGLEVTLAYVGKPSDKIQSALDAATAKLKGAGLDVDQQVLAGEADKALSELTNNGDYQMLVMGAFSRSRLRSLFIGSTTMEMIRACKIAIMLVH